MRKTILLFTTMALVLLLAAGMAWAAAGPPTVTSTVPTDGAINVDPTAKIKAKFSEPMKEGSINTTTFYLLKGNFSAANPPASVGSGATTTTSCATTTPATTTTPAVTTPVTCPAAITATVNYNEDTNTAKLIPSAALDFSAAYTAVVEGTGDGDMRAVKDRGGTAMATDKLFHFTTASAPPPIP
jgi:hypothetical protein